MQYLIFAFILFSPMDDKTREFFERLKVQLENNHAWPAEYLFKFIVPTDREKVLAVENAFNGMGAVVNTKKSKNEHYTSISINVMLDNPDHVIAKYLEVASIEGIISL